jgi:MFS family permease
LFSLITAQWYRRSEQPLRVAAWYGTNGIATIFASILAYGLVSLLSYLFAPANDQGHINSENFKAWQALYLVAGILTVASAPIVWFFLDSDIESCRFLTETEKKMAYERLRANQTGTGTREWKWDQVIEVFVDPKSYIWLGIVMLPNIGAAVTNVFGPTLIKGFGYDKYV